MAVRKAQIPRKLLRKVKLADIPVVGSDGQQEVVTYTEFNGALLVPVGDAHLFNSSPSSVRRYIRQGELTPYLENGQVKTDNRSTKVYFDLYEYMDMNKNQNQPTG